jgi:hypothetical protein
MGSIRTIISKIWKKPKTGQAFLIPKIFKTLEPKVVEQELQNLE